ncbi:MAG: hypothetical protein P4L61_01815 [Candidatus Pacebacteria bacterium]|nr:hypothetical protein [Candidatus Paceibacterota bacterium]
MTAAKESVQFCDPQCPWVGTTVKGEPHSHETSSMLSSCDEIPRNCCRQWISGPAPLQFSKTEDDDVWAASVRCWTLHAKLAQELEAEVERQNSASIEVLGVERFRALSDLAKTLSLGLDGIILKKNILVLLYGSHDEFILLLNSCLSDCDRVIGSHDQLSLMDIEPELAAVVACFFETAMQLEREADRYDACSEKDLSEELTEFYSAIQKVTEQLEATLHALATLSAKTLGGLKAKFRVIETCDEYRGASLALLSLQRSMFGDLDGLLQLQIKKAALPAPQENESLAMKKRGVRAT